MNTCTLVLTNIPVEPGAISPWTKTTSLAFYVVGGPTAGEYVNALEDSFSTRPLAEGTRYTFDVDQILLKLAGGQGVFAAFLLDSYQGPEYPFNWKMVSSQPLVPGAGATYRWDLATGLINGGGIMGSVTLYGKNFPVGTYAWRIRYYDPAAGQWQYWTDAVTIDQPILISNVGLAGAWLYTGCQAAVHTQFGPFGPYSFGDGQSYQIDVQTGAIISGPPPVQPAKCAFVGTPGMPAEANQGDQVTISATIKNDGGSWGALTVLTDLPYAGVMPEPQPPWLQLYPGESGVIQIKFAMPACSISFSLWAVHWNYDTGVWVTDAMIGPFTINLKLGQPEVRELTVVECH